MKYYRVLEQFGKIHLCVETSDGVLTSLTSVNDLVNSYEVLLDVADISGVTVDNLTKNVLAQGKAVTFDLTELIEWSIKKSGPAFIIKPIEPEEMWAGGLGNMIMDEEALANANEDTRLAYNTPSISTTIYKGTNHRLVGPFDKIGVREDTERTIAEGEIVFIIYKGKFAGISTGNEVAGTLAGLSSNWAVPSKVFKGCASIGPCILSLEDVKSPLELHLELKQFRGKDQIGQSDLITKFKRTPEEIIASTVAHDSPPKVVIQYTGGFVVAKDGDDIASLEQGDVVRISLEGVGFVENEVEVV
ncbi:MAG: hypothetical protein FI718_03670 [SAR202 cluster bacterium]|nr:hypothetical protein [SAR202 cluster bacterium]